MPAIRDRAIVLKRLDYSETSQVVAVYTRTHGKVRIIAKGARRSTKRQFKPGLELLESGDLLLSVRHVRQEALAQLSDWSPVRAFLGLRDRLDRLFAAQYAADCVAQLTEDWDPHAVLYDALYGLLDVLCDVDDVMSVLAAFQRTLLDEVGLLPQFEDCVGCGCCIVRSGGGDGGVGGVGGDIYFSSFEGGLLCRDCEAARVEKRLVRVSLKWLRGCDGPPDCDVYGLFDLYHYHLSHVMGRSPAGGDRLARMFRG